jgi:tRNA uridine 5-carboxymethylaminomethyl modification enzyme
VLPQVACHLTSTNARTHAIVRANIHRAPMYAGRIQGVGPRYCPSVEDKVMRFADKERHLVFLEPEGLDTDVVYVNGVSTSLPAPVQEDLLRTIAGLENARFLRHGYAVEYDFVAPSQLTDALAVRAVPGLWLAGQINGTSGYEEAAGQGLVAGANAALWALSRPAFVLRRDEAYVGVMVDDLVVTDPTEPYRMFTSRAEHRLLLRCDNALERLVPRARAAGLVGDDALERLAERRAERGRVEAALRRIRREGKSLAERLLRPEVTWASLVEEVPELGAAGFDPDVAESVATGLKYQGYVERAAENVERLRAQDELEIPSELDYAAIRGLANEARDKLSRLRPRTLGAAGRIAGVRPPDVALVAVHVERLRRARAAGRRSAD